MRNENGNAPYKFHVSLYPPPFHGVPALSLSPLYKAFTGFVSYNIKYIA
jgi:hypothetical protein